MPAKKRIVYPIQLDPELDEKITYAAERLCMPKAEVMRMAIAIGLEHLRRINFDIVGALCQTPAPHLSMVAEEPSKSKPSPATTSPSTPVAGVKYPMGKARRKKA